MEDMVIPDVMNDVYLPQGSYSENFMLISQLEVCQEGGYLEDVGEVPDARLGGQGHP